MNYPQPTIVHNGLVCCIERWHDPGEYPSGAGGGPLASRDYIAGINGRIILRYDNETIRWHETEIDESISEYGWDKVVCYDIENMDLLNKIPVERSGDARDDCDDVRITPIGVTIMAVNYDADGTEVVAEIEDFTECN